MSESRPEPNSLETLTRELLAAAYPERGAGWVHDQAARTAASALGALDDAAPPGLPPARPFGRALRETLAAVTLSPEAPRVHVLSDDLDLRLTATRTAERYSIVLRAEHLDPTVAVPAGLWLTARPGGGRLRIRHLARLDEAGHAEFGDVPAGEWGFGVIETAGEAGAIPLPVVRPVPYALAAAGGDYAVALPGRFVLLLAEPTGGGPYVLELLSPGGPLRVLQVHYRDAGDRPRTLLVPGAHRSQVRLPGFAPARPWSVAEVTNLPGVVAEGGPELIRTSVEAAANRVTALAWRALGHEDPPTT